MTSYDPKHESVAKRNVCEGRGRGRRAEKEKGDIRVKVRIGGKRSVGGDITVYGDTTESVKSNKI